jgi:TetR/AcrR family transcriptional regulator, mexCD-oprJ operon repressor
MRPSTDAPLAWRAMAEQATDHRRATAERNIEAILDAAEALLRRRERASISAVAAEASVSRPTVYAHFPDRKRLLEAVVERSVRRWIASTERIDPGRGPADEALGRLIEVSWEEISRSSHIAEAAAAELDSRAMQRSHDMGRELIRRLTERGRREGTFRTDVPTEWLVSSLFALIHATRDDVTSGKLGAGEALDALMATVPDLFRG